MIVHLIDRILSQSIAQKTGGKQGSLFQSCVLIIKNDACVEDRVMEALGIM